MDRGIIAWCDLDQIELRVPALLCGEPFFFDAYRLGWDLHSRAAVRIWGEHELINRHPTLASLPIDRWKTYTPFNIRERQVGKPTRLAHLFRSGADAMQSAILGDIGELLPLQLFDRIVRARPSEVPVLWAWQEDRIAEARRTGRVTLPLTGQSRASWAVKSTKSTRSSTSPSRPPPATPSLRIQSRVHFLLRERRIHTILPFLNVYDAIKFDLRSPADLPLLRSLFQEAVEWVFHRQLLGPPPAPLRPHRPPQVRPQMEGPFHPPPT